MLHYKWLPHAFLLNAASDTTFSPSGETAIFSSNLIKIVDQFQDLMHYTSSVLEASVK